MLFIPHGKCKKEKLKYNDRKLKIAVFCSSLLPKTGTKTEKNSYVLQMAFVKFVSHVDCFLDCLIIFYVCEYN